MDDIKSFSTSLLIGSCVATIFVLAYILSRISPETRRITKLERHPCASSLKTSTVANAIGAAQSSREGDAAAEDAQFCDAMLCTDPDALVKLGRMYAMGDGVPASLTRAFALFFRAAGMGHARGMCYVAAAYHFGQGVSESRFDALRWYQRSAALGDSLAKKKIGEFGLVDVPALIRSRALHSIKNFTRRMDKAH